MSQVLSIVASGMVSAVGLSAPASCAAIRCALDNFQETRFIDQGGEWLLAASVPLEQPWRGRAKLLKMAARAIDEALRGQPDLDYAELPLLLCVAEGDRPDAARGSTSLSCVTWKASWDDASIPPRHSSPVAGSVARWPCSTRAS